MAYSTYGDDVEPLSTIAQAESRSYSSTAIVSVLETGRTYQFDSTSTAIRDGKRILAPSGGGRLLNVPWVLNATEVEFSTPTTHLQDLQAVISHNWSASLMDGGGFTDNGDGTYSLAAAEAALRQPTGGQGATIGLYNVSAVNNQSITDGTQTYITVKLTGSTAAYSTQQDLSLITGRDEIEAYSITRVGNGYHVVDLRRQNVDHAQLACRMEWDTKGISKVPGTAYSSSPSNRYLQVSAGKFHTPIRLSSTSAFDTSGSSTFTQIHGSTASGWTRTTGQTQINNTNYNDGSGTLATLTANQWGVRWVFMDVDTTGAGLSVLIGPNNGSEADANLATLPPDLPPELRKVAPGVLISKIIVQKNAASITASWISNYDAVTQRQSTPTTVHDSLGGLLGNGTYHLSQAERDAAIRIASPSQSGLMSDAQATAVSLIRGSGTTAQRNALTGLSAGQQWYNTDITVLETYSGSYWLSPGRILLENRTTGNSETGRSVQISTAYDFSVTYPNSASNDIDVIGVIETAGIAVGSDMVVNVGRGNVVDVLMETNDTTVSGDYVFARSGGLNYSSVSQANGAFAISLETKNNAGAAYLVKCLLISTELK